MRGREKFARYKGLIDIAVGAVSVYSIKRRKKWLDKSRKTQGNRGILIRYILVKSLAKHCGDNVAIFEDVHLRNIANMSFGNNVSIQPMCYLEGGNDNAEGIYIGNDVSIAHGSSILAETHVYDRIDIPIKDQGLTCRKTTIGNGSWIGAKVTILCGVKIGDNCIVAANAVVNRDVDDNTVVGGVPSKVIRNREGD